MQRRVRRQARRHCRVGTNGYDLWKLALRVVKKLAVAGVHQNLAIWQCDIRYVYRIAYSQRGIHRAIPLNRGPWHFSPICKCRTAVLIRAIPCIIQSCQQFYHRHSRMSPAFIGLRTRVELTPSIVDIIYRKRRDFSYLKVTSPADAKAPSPHGREICIAELKCIETVLSVVALKYD